MEPQTIVTEDLRVKRDDNRVVLGAPIVQRYDRTGIISKINRRISDVTGLDVSDHGANFMHVLRYSVGCFYGLHYDSIVTEEVSDDHYRLATWINY